MSIDANFHAITSAKSSTHKAPGIAFDAVTISDRDGSEVSLFLPIGTGQAVADAINAAISVSNVEAAA